MLRDFDGAATAAIIVEIQLQRDSDKCFVWPLYIAALRATLVCPVVLLVVTTDAGVASWARQPIELGHPELCLRPLVIDYSMIPALADVELARRIPELAVLAALAQRDLVTAEVALLGIAALPEHKQTLHWDLIVGALPDGLRSQLETRMIRGYQYQTDFARKYFEEGREALASVALQLLDRKLGAVDAADAEWLRAQTSLETLTALIGTLLDARDPTEARAALDAARRA